MNLSDPREWLQFGLLVWNVGLTAAVWLRKPGMDAARAVQELRIDIDIRMKNHSDQIIEMRTHMSHMPTTDQLTTLKSTVTQINERSVGLNDAMLTMRTSLGRIEDYLLRNHT
jgi:predicted  nucleic acid-binding Zn-ribbon protein